MTHEWYDGQPITASSAITSFEMILDDVLKEGDPSPSFADFGRR
jgi:hypothetical protein